MYVLLVALAIDTQFAPAESQSSHWYANVIGVDPDQLPFDAVSTCPTCAEPEIDGGLVFAGGVAEQAVVDVLNVACPDRLPAASYASTPNVKLAPQASPVTVNDVLVVVATLVLPLYTPYPLTPTLSVDGFHESEALFCPTDAASPVGVDGGVVSGQA